MSTNDTINNQSLSGDVHGSLADERALPQDVLEALGPGRFTDVKYVSSGATSSVFSAHDNVLDKRVAIKLLQHASAEKLVSFQTEAKTACKLDHRHLVKTLNFGVTSKNHAFLIMDFVDGQSLESIIQAHGTIPIANAISLVMQILDGMAHSHGKNIAHRDLKTSNILVQDYGNSNARAIVVDFGLAKERQSQDQTTQGSSSGKVKGSPLYISPEQAQGKHGDERSDIYSLGCIMLRMLTGALPFEADDLFELLRKHIEQPAPTLSELAPHIDFSPLLESCVQRMMEKDPDDRFQTIGEITEYLRKVPLTTAVATAPNPSPPVVPSRRVRKRTAALIICLALLAVSLAVWQFVILPKMESARPGMTSTIAESPHKKFRRLFKYDVGNFLSHFTHLHVVPKDPDLLTDADLDCLSQVELRCPDIYLAFTKISGTGLASLGTIRDLQLDLTKTRLNDEAYKTIGQLKNLRGLSLAGTTVTPEQLKEVVKCGGIREINIDLCPNITDESMDVISTMPLEAFTARDAKTITDAGLRKLAKCTNLAILHLDGADINDQTIEALSALTRVLDIRANRCKSLTGRALRSICTNHPKIQYIGMSFANLQSEDILCLKPLSSNLVFLEFIGVPIKPQDLQLFGQMPKLQFLYLSHIQDPDALKYVYPLKNLVRISLVSSPNISNGALAELQRNLPDTLLITSTSDQIPGDMRDFCTMFLAEPETP